MKVKKARSLVILCITYFTFYSMLLLSTYSVIQYIIEQKLQRAFPTMEAIQEYEYQLRKDEYSKIPYGKFAACSYIVFHADGRILYASNQRIRDRITIDDLPLIRDFDNSSEYLIYDYSANTTNGRYYIQQNYYNEETGFTEVQDYCWIDDNLNVLDGTLFAKKGYLTVREFNFIRGFYHADETVSKWTYESEDGEERTLVLIAPVLTIKAYDEITSSTKILWLGVLPVILSGSVLFTLLFHHKLKGMINTLNGKIQICHEAADCHKVREEVPLEFWNTMDTLEQLMTQLDMAQKEKQRIIADLSHDLKTPLSVVIGCSQAFVEHMIPEEEKEKYMLTIFKRSQMAANLIDTLVDYTKLDHPDYTPKLRAINLCEYIKEFLAEHYAEIEMADFRLSVAFPEKPVIVLADAILFQKCLENLIGNALYYNPAGTTIYVCLRENSESAVITIADNGIGIKAEIADKIFEPFVTGNTARSSGKGTGLGLSIVKKIVEMHHGTVQLIMPPSNHYATEFELTLKKT